MTIRVATALMIPFLFAAAPSPQDPEPATNGILGQVVDASSGKPNGTYPARTWSSRQAVRWLSRLQCANERLPQPEFRWTRQAHRTRFALARVWSCLPRRTGAPGGRWPHALAANEWFDPGVLEKLSTGALRISIGEADVKAVDVVVRE